MKSLALAAAAALAPLASAQAGEARCWFEQGVVVVSATVGDIPGDYILDTAAPITLLHETRAQAAGVGGQTLRAAVRLAGRRTGEVEAHVADLDARTWAFPTPVAGVIGADALQGQVLDLSFHPCRVALHAPGTAPPLAGARPLPVRWVGGSPAAFATVADATRAQTGLWSLSTGWPELRISDRLARIDGLADAAKAYPPEPAPARLAAAGFAGRAAYRPWAGLIAAGETGDLAGRIGAEVLSAQRLRIDFAGRRVWIAQQKGPPDEPAGP